MNTLAEKLTSYIFETAGVPVVWGPDVSVTLPQYLKQRYSLIELSVNRRWFLGVLLKDKADFKPAVFEKHLRQIIPRTENFEGYLLISEGLPSYVRKRLVERKIPFIVPGLQMFWPDLGLSRQLRSSKKELLPVDVVSPATQAVLVFALTKRFTEPVPAKVLADKLNYTAMTISRALDEIEGSKIAIVERKGRERLFASEFGVPLWEQVQPYMRNPVRETVRIEEKKLPLDIRITAGETALAQQSMLAPPREQIYAMGRENWKNIATDVEAIPVEDEGTCLVQLWRYDPALFAIENVVDPFSLYLSLKDSVDERVQSALDEIMEKTLWS